MDCLTAQGLISDAVDRAPLDAATLAQAKTHCQTCPTCSVFVRTLLLVKNAPLPQPPEDLTDRVMAGVRAEALLARQRAAVQAAALEVSAETTKSVEAGGSDTPADPASASATGAQEMPRAVITSLRRWTGSLSRPEMIGWASAAVIFVAAVGITANAGMRVLTATPTLSTEKAATDGTAENRALSQPAAPSAESADSIAGAAVVATPGSFITVNGVVFALGGPSTIATDGLKPVGSTTSALGSGSGPTSHDVYSGDDPERVYLTDEATRQQLAFGRVVRQYAGRTYQLTSAEVSDFGQWPTLPAQIPAPAGPDGAPTFVALAPAGAGPQVYRLASGSADAGIGIGPGSDPADAAAGNPNWTWWTPVQ